MTSDDTSVPEDDTIAEGARRALRRLADGGTGADSGSWADVETGARRVRRRRFAMVSTVGAVVLVAGAAIAIAIAIAGDPGANRSGPRVGTDVTSTTSLPTTSTRTTGASSVTAPTATTPVTGPPATGGSGAAPPPNLGEIYPGDPPAVDDFTGQTGVTRGGDVPVSTMDVFDEVEVGASITNVTNRTIWASSSLVPTALAVVCTNATSTVQSLFPMTNLRMAPGDSDGGGGRFRPTHDYIGTVTCALDVITPGTGTRFDSSAGGEDARATIVGPVTRVAPVSIEVRPVTFTLDRLGRFQPGDWTIGLFADDVVNAMGQPDATTTATFLAPGRPDHKALGYDCSDAPATDRIPMHVQPQTAGPYCRTIFYVNLDSERVAGFRTTSTTFRTDRGTTVGTSEADAVRQEQVQQLDGCFSGIRIRDPRNDVEIHLYVGSQASDVVTQLAAEEDTQSVGLFFC